MGGNRNESLLKTVLIFLALIFVVVRHCRIHDCHACHACHAREKTLYHNRSHAIMVGEVFTLYHNNNSDQKGVKCIFLLFLGTAPERKKNS
jgi:hypothetical protein